MKRISGDLALGVIAFCISILAIVVWIPADTGSGLVESSRGSMKIGDAFAPTLGFALLGFAGLVLTIEARVMRSTARLDLRDMAFILIVSGTYLLSMLIMRWAGPLAASLFSDETYRNLRDTLPWKYLGYTLGGAFMIGTLISLVNRRITPAAYGLGLIVSLGIAALYDLPFDDLLLPPNGDV